MFLDWIYAKILISIYICVCIQELLEAWRCGTVGQDYKFSGAAAASRSQTPETLQLKHWELEQGKLAI